MPINYNATKWETGKLLNPSNMNNMENGIKSACDGVDVLSELPDVIRRNGSGEDGGSRNLITFPYNDGYSKTDNGVTFTVNSDGTIEANGTASSSASATFEIMLTNRIKLEAGKTYTISGCPSGGSAQTWYLRSYYYAQASGGSAISNKSDYGDGSTFVAIEGQEYIRITVRVYVGNTVSGLLFKPMLEEGGVRHEYEPYYPSNKELYKLVDNSSYWSGGTTYGSYFYIDGVNGSDENDGISESTPFKTLEKALSVNRKDLRIRILTAGTYNLGQRDISHSVIHLFGNVDNIKVKFTQTSDIAVYSNHINFEKINFELSGQNMYFDGVCVRLYQCSFSNINSLRFNGCTGKISNVVAPFFYTEYSNLHMRNCTVSATSKYSSSYAPIFIGNSSNVNFDQSLNFYDLTATTNSTNGIWVVGSAVRFTPYPSPAEQSEQSPFSFKCVNADGSEKAMTTKYKSLLYCQYSDVFIPSAINFSDVATKKFADITEYTQVVESNNF